MPVTRASYECVQGKSYSLIGDNGDEGMNGEVKIKLGESNPALPSPVAAKLADETEFDPWALPELQDQGLKWSELSPWGKVLRALVVICKLVGLVGLLYLFICSLDFLGSAFRLLGGKYAGQVMSQSDMLRNPVVGLMLGILATVLLQSSSTSTSIVVTMVGSRLLEVRHAIPIIMGANIGTSVTNTIVSIVQSPDRNEFRRAFAAATVHDMFNWLTVIVLLPIEVITGYLEALTDALLTTQNWNTKDANVEFLTLLTKPFTNVIIQLDKNIVEQIANGDEDAMNKTMIKRCCKKEKNGTECFEKCSFALVNLEWSDSFVGLLLLGISLVILCTCLILMVKILHSMLRGQIAKVIKTTINAEYKFPFSILIGYVAILIGCIMTILVQSSSIFTSALTPLAGIGVISLERMYPLTLGSNIGTTTTGILAALATKGNALKPALQIAFCHMFFNISGILLFYPIPFMRFPIGLAKALGNTTAQYRWFSILYLVLMFIVLPAGVFGLSYAGPLALMSVGIPILAVAVIVIIINVLQRKLPSILPTKLQSWNWLPECLRSLDPMDRVINRVFGVFGCCTKVLQQSGGHDPNALGGMRPNQSQINILERRSSTPTSCTTETHIMNGMDNKAFVWQGNGKTNAQNTFL